MITTKKRAWVIRWEDVATSPIQRKVIAIMDSRISGERIRWLDGTASPRVRVAKSGRVSWVYPLDTGGRELARRINEGRSPCRHYVRG